MLKTALLYSMGQCNTMDLGFSDDPKTIAHKDYIHGSRA